MWAGELRHEQQQGCLLPELHVVGGEEAVAALADAAPPAVVDHLDVGDEVVGVEGDLVVTRCRESPTGSAPPATGPRQPQHRGGRDFWKLPQTAPGNLQSTPRNFQSALLLSPQIPDFSFATTRNIERQRKNSHLSHAEQSFQSQRVKTRALLTSLVIVKGYGCDPKFILILIIRVFF